MNFGLVEYVLWTFKLLKQFAFNNVLVTIFFLGGGVGGGQLKMILGLCIVVTPTRKLVVFAIWGEAFLRMRKL